MKEDAKKPVKPAPRPTRPLDKDATAQSKPAGAATVKPAVSRPAPKPVTVKPTIPQPGGAKPHTPADDLDSFAHQAPRPVIKVTETSLAEHTVVEGQTLSDIALKYYKSATREKWMKIYEANKALIGDNPNLIKPGLVLKIPKID